MTAKRVQLRFYEELNDFLPRELRRRSYRREIFLSPAVKDVIEAEGVPHTEVDLVLVNGESVGFEHRLQDGDRVAVYPVFEALDIGPLQRLRPEPLRRPRFAVDSNLGALARNLRLLGFDCAYRRHWDDHHLVDTALAEHRAVLTRDVGVLKHGRLDHGYWVRADDPDRQVLEVLARFDLWRQVAPFTRCMVCNGEVAPVPAQAVKDRVPAGVLAARDRFYRCAGCGRVYWEGSHHAALERRVARWRQGSP